MAWPGEIKKSHLEASKYVTSCGLTDLVSLNCHQRKKLLLIKIDVGTFVL